MKSLFYLLLFILLSFTWASSEQVQAATIAKVKDKPKTVTVTLDGSESKVNIEKNMMICFIMNRKKFSCGHIIEANPGQLTVVVKRNFNRIKDGMVVDFIAKKNPKKMVDTSEKTRPPSFGVRIFWTPYFVRYTRANYDINAYQGAEPKGTITSMWAKQSSAVTNTNGNMFYSFNGELEFKAFNLRFGTSYKSYPVVSYKYFYDISKREQFLEAENSGYAFSLYGDYVFLTLFDALNFAGGLEAEISQMQLKGMKGSDNSSSSETLYEAKSSRTIFSLRLPIRYDFSFSKAKMFNFTKNNFLNNLGIFAGVTVAVPFASFGSNTVNEASDPLNGTKISKPLGEDIKDALNHRHSSWAFETNVGGYFLF